jgi:hypothetical protein
MQAPRYQVSYYLISEVIKEKQQNRRNDLFNKENTKKKKKSICNHTANKLRLTIFHSNKTVK